MLMNPDGWQMLASLAGMAFTVGFVDQIRMTRKMKTVEGLSLLQWIVFATASAFFSLYYAHLDQWLMVSVSIFGTACCLTIIGMFFHYRQEKI